MSKFIILFTFGLAITSFASDYRSFTDKEGRTINAKVLKVDKGTKEVTLERENKKKATVSISIFSEADQEYINSWSVAPKLEESLRTNSDPKTTPTNLSKVEVKKIGQMYAACLEKQDEMSKFYAKSDEVSKFYDKSIDRSSKDFISYFRDYYLRTEFSEIEDLRFVRNTKDFFLMELKVIHTTSSSKVRRSGPFKIRALLTADGKIKYETIIQPHPVEELAYLLLTYSGTRNIDRWKNSFPPRSYTMRGKPIQKLDGSKEYHPLDGRKLRFTTLLKECGSPPFGVETDPGRMGQLEDDEREEMKDALKDVIDWLLENGTHIDISLPKVFMTEESFEEVSEMLEDTRDVFKKSGRVLWFFEY